MEKENKTELTPNELNKEETNEVSLNNEEVPVNEEKSEEIKAEENNENASENKEEVDPIYNKQQFVESFSYDSEYLNNIEEERKKFYKFSKSQNIIKWVVALLGLGVIAFSCLGLPTIFVDDKGKALSWVFPTMIGLVVISLAAILAYTFVLKRILRKKMSAYFYNYYQNMSEYVFDKKNYKEFNLQKPDKIAKIQFDENYLFEGVAEVGSRGLTDFVYKDRNIMVCDCSAQVKDTKRIYPIFVGKYLIGPSKYEGDERIVVYIKGDDRGIYPTNVSDLECVHEDDDLNVYTNNKNWKKVINTTVMRRLKAIKTGSQLVDLALSTYNGHTYICMGYDDPIMMLPFDHAFDPNPIKEYKNDLLLVCKLIEALSK